MALTRAMLKGMGLTEEQVSAIIEEHTTVTSSLKEQIKTYKNNSEKLTDVQKELNDLKADIKKNNWQKKYEDEHNAFESYKTNISNKEAVEKVKSAYKKLLSECKVGDKHIDSILKVTDFSNMKLKDDGSFEDLDNIKKEIASEWSGFISTKDTKGTDVDNPPADDDGDKSGASGIAAELAKKYHDSLYGTVKEN